MQALSSAKYQGSRHRRIHFRRDTPQGWANVIRRPGKPSDLTADLMGKNGLLTREIARDLISLDLQGKVKTTSEYAQLFRAGQGTVQKAFKTLEDMGAIELESRGHLG